MDEETKKKIMEMQKKGLTAYKIAQKLGVNYGGVRYVTDPKFREYLRQAHKKYFAKLKGKETTPEPQDHLTPEDAKWLSQHRQNVERRNRILKGTGVFFYCFAFAFAIAIFLALIPGSFAFLFASIALLVAFILVIVITPNKYASEAIVGTLGGFSVGVVIALIYISPMASIAQYPISMQVFYPNHPNLTITQNCTAFSVSSSGYLNGQPLNQTNTTACSLPQNMAPSDSNPFNCNISNKSITCSGSSYIKNVTWQGTILNVSKR